MSVLMKLVDSHRHLAHGRAIEYGQMLLALDPLQEQMHRRLMEIYRDSGHTEDAVKQYRRCQSVLLNGLNLMPELATQALYQAIVSGRGQADQHSPTNNTRPVSEAIAEVATLSAVRTLRQTAALTRQLKFAQESCRDSGLGQTILVRGDAGIGKTRLMQELVKYGLSNGFSADIAKISDREEQSISNLTHLVRS